MIQNYITYRIVTLFFDYPARHFQLREISRILKLGLPSVRNHVRQLEKEGLLKKEKRGVYYSYASSGSDVYKIYKRNDLLIRLHASGLVEFIADAFVPDAIILFGSASRGEDIEASDIDLFLVAKEKDVELKNFEKKLHRKISLHFEEKISDIPKELLNNIINGIVVYGYLKVF
ncbi:MAG: nucleotidyltransferase domain-containing protein [Candidatus Aenigmarchaeota archaeon]|nr:nucleotidyltransferase domain-containing protein [Candidatus Aenigmarchaeota archaeon]